MNLSVSYYSCLFACMTSLTVEREQGQTLAAVLRLSPLIASHCHMPASVQPLSQWRPSHSVQWKPHLSLCGQLQWVWPVGCYSLNLLPHRDTAPAQ